MKYILRHNTVIAAITLLASPQLLAANDKEVQDMSDPLAVYTQLGAGYTNRGVNIKVGQAYDTGKAITTGMNVLELIGGAGEAVGWDGDEDSLDNSFDELRFRNFGVNLENGRGSQLDINLKFDKTPLADMSGTISYSLIQALPKLWEFNFYPLAGAGLNFGENVRDDDGSVDSGYSVNGSFGLLGLYSKLVITDKLWVNYNPFWFSTLGGAGNYQDNAYGVGQSDILTHEFALSYQISPVFNARYFANWNEEVSFDNGNHRIEFNYQL